MLTPEAQRVLAALCDAAGEPPVETIPLRRIAVACLGDWSEGLKALEELDCAGYLRASIVGWIEGWVTARGRTARRTVAAR
jgi:hypothetical protein